jgi:hypothetical protein
MLKPLPKSFPAFLVVVMSALTFIAAGCGSSKATTTPTVVTTQTSAGNAAPASTRATTAPPATATTTEAATGGLSGSWSGQYSGAYSGTFSLTWQQSGSSLSGTIKISSFNNTSENINGSLQGSAIEFGTVGSQAVQYSGTVSGSSMSGTWKIGANGTEGGSWSATKSS